uniref:EphrinA-d ephrin n=1 Tax=Phallusia mammillata TaxID=59560 RepID=A0A6F9DCH0_9ASCI|nr:EphrinA-d ephrin precursor [Phallusia mammillata]
MNMMRFASMFVLFYFCQCCVGGATRHVLYWNSIMSPQLKDRDHITHVKIGEFMDILCPHRSLQGITGGPREPATFDLLNVTESEYNECHARGKGKFMFACNKPERENKLTLKFQTISPSPLGFRFQYCADYYFMALPRGRRSRHGCSKDTTRIHIRVACKDETTTVETTTEATTTTVKTAKPEDVLSDVIKRIRHHKKPSADPVKTEDIVIPELTNPFDIETELSENNPQVLKVVSGHRDVGGGENSASSFGKSTLLLAATVTAGFVISKFIVS